MRFGICTAVENAADVKAAGWDFVEENVQGLLQGQLPDAQWNGADRVRNAAVPVLSANCLVPGTLKITGPDASPDKLRAYMAAVLKRARQLGIHMLVFGSGGARQVPEGFDRENAKQQIIAFGRMSAEIAAEYGVTLVVEHLNKGECNIINSVPEAMTYVKAVSHPNFQCLVDSYHFWTEEEGLEGVQAAAPWVKHVHLADKAGRVPPGESGMSDYRPFFRIFKQGGYAGLMSVEASGFKDIKSVGPKVLAFLKKQWKEA